MQLSRFWTGIIRPILEIVHPATLVEIGCESGEHTRHLLEFCGKQGCIVHVIDPAPTFNVEAWQKQYGSAFVFHKDLSLNVLPRIGHCEAALIDGDHNWYTVYHELLLLEKNSDPQSPFPVVFLHDIEWPYGRRDMYHDPELIPPAFRKAYRRKGILPGHGQPLEKGGLNSTFCHAVEENNMQNGVLTAIEDFLTQTKRTLRFVQVPGGHGLGILVDAALLEKYEELAPLLDVLEPVEPLRGHLQAIDAERMNRIIRMAETNNRLQTLERDRENELAELDRVHIEYKQLVLASDLFRKEASDIRQVLERTEASRVSLESSVRAQQMRADLLETEKRQQEASYTALRLQYDRVEEQLHTARIDLEKANRERQQLENLRKQFDLQAQELDETRGVLTHVFSTRSWKWTKPIRQLEGAIRRLFRARPSPAHPISRWPAIAPDLPAPADDSPAPRGSYAAYCARMLLTENRMIASQQRAASKRDLPLVSVVLPMRSFQELLLRKACNSLLEQTYPHWELIIVNDGCLHPALPVIVADLQHAAPDHVRLIKTGEDGPERTGLRASSGAYVAWMDAHDEWEADALERMLWAMHGSAMMNLGYADHDMLDAIGIRGNPTLKPACSPELLLQGNYIGPTFMVRTEAAMACLNQADRTADFRYILLLQLCEVPERVVHVPHVLFHLRIAALTKERIDADRHAIETTLQRRNLPHAVEQRDLPRSTYPVFRLGFSASHSPIVTLIIPMKDGADLLRTCIESIRARTDYPAYEILVIDNGSQEPQTLQYLRDANVRVLRIETDSFNFAAINTQAAQAASSELLLFLNSDTKPASPGWLRELVGTMRLDPRIGAVAPKLLYPITVRGMRVQHAGMLLGRHLASLIQFPTRQELGWNLFNQVTHNCAAVSGAALLTRKTLFFEVGGFDAEHFAVDFCDVDYCLKLLERGFRTVCVPSAELYHLESASRGDNKGRGATLNPKEAEAFRTKWGYLLPHDPYYHPHLLRDGGLFRMDPAANPDAQPRRATTHLVNVAVPQPPSQ